MLPILLGYYSPQGAILVSPLFFGVAHFHHMIEKISRGQEVKTAFFVSSFQVRFNSGMVSLASEEILLGLGLSTFWDFRWVEDL